MALTPSGESSSRRWARATASLFLSGEEFDDEKLAAVLATGSSDRWIVWDGDGSDFHSHLRVWHWEATEDEPESYQIELRSFPSPPPPAESKELAVTHEQCIDALLKAAPDVESFHPTHRVDLFFESPPAQWRIPLLADPPDLGELGADLGHMTLSGLSLQFRDSPQALVQATLQTSPSDDEFFVGLLFAGHLSRDQLSEMAEGVRTAETMAKIFVSGGTDA